MRTRYWHIGLSVAAAALLTATPARAEYEREEWSGLRRMVGDDMYELIIGRDEHRDRRHSDGDHWCRYCRRVWVPGEDRVVTERQWVPGHFTERAIPAKVEWTWMRKHGKHHRRHHNDRVDDRRGPQRDWHRPPPLIVVTNDAHNPPPRPDKHVYGKGYWERRILCEERVVREWVPGCYETVQRTVHTPGHYKKICRRH